MGDGITERLSEILGGIEGAEERFAILRACLRWTRAVGHPTEDVADRIAARLGAPREKARAVAAFVRDLASAPPGSVIHRCVSVSCCASGAERLFECCGEDLRAACPNAEIRTVHCLDQCDRGPSLGFGRAIYTGSAEEVVADERTWRDEPFGVED